MLLAALITCVLLIGPLAADARTVTPGADLASVVADTAAIEIELAPGEYRLRPRDYVDPTCGNCADPETPAHATLGIRLRGHGRVLRAAPDPSGGDGRGAASPVLVTGAGYGILVEDCHDCLIEGIVVTGGVRDPDGNATDAAIVVRRSTLTIRDCRITDNIGDANVIEDVVVGVIGIAGREGADISIAGNQIIGNSWDGVALYRDARAHIEGNVIDGVDRARGRTAGGGRGVGIGVTWNARATVRGNLVRNYWKGIGVFVDAVAIIEENVIEDVLTWGISLWDAGHGRPAAIIQRNAVYRTGACGIAIVRASGALPPPGRVVGNALVATGQDPKYDSGEPYCEQRAIARHAVPEELSIHDNLFFANREPGGARGSGDAPDQPTFELIAADLLGRLEAYSVLRRSRFLERFGGR